MQDPREAIQRNPAKGAGPKLAVVKFTSCDGCQLSLLDCEEELMVLWSRLHIAHFLEASSLVQSGPYDLCLVEGSISMADDLRKIEELRQCSRVLVTIGACATSGGIQALRHGLGRDFDPSRVYPHPEWVKTLDQTTAIGHHVPVDFALHGCPIDKHQLIEVITAFLDGRSPQIPEESVCADCKRRGLPCVAVAQGMTCLGPITQAGCGALCPASRRGCYGCFGSKENPNVAALAAYWRQTGLSHRDIWRALQMFHAEDPYLKEVSQHYDDQNNPPGASHPC